jgi:hypothetical protein
VLAFDDANAAIRFGRYGLAGLVQPVTGEAGRGPLPDIAGEVGKAVLIDPEAAEGARVLVAGIAAGLALVLGEPAL